MKYMVSILLFLLIPIMMVAQDRSPNKYGVDENFVVPVGIPVDTVAPRIQGVSIDGEKIDSDELIKTGPVVVMFYRGEWCPVCNNLKFDYY
jgi:thiol-disulfide isomerase/thioredoxin